MQALQPLNEHVIVRPDERVQISPGGIHVVSGKDEPPTTGTVLAHGEDVPFDVYEGSRVVFNRYVAVEYEFEGGEKVLVLKNSDLLAKIVERD